MGQKCSCLFNDENQIFLFRQFGTNEISNKSKGTTTLNSQISMNIKNFNEFPYLQITKLQGLVRGFVKRKYFKKKERYELEQLTNSLLHELENKYSNEFTIKSKSIYPPFDKNGWTKYYESDVNNKEKCLRVKLIKEIDAYYVGGVNLKKEKHGYGELTNKDGSKLLGNWVNNNFTGWGRFIDTRGNLAEGKIFYFILGLFLNFLLNGKGAKINFEGTITYTGMFKNGLKEGEGIEECEEYIYEGEYKNDLKEGKGKLKYKRNNDSYEGEFSDNAINGIGNYTWSNKHTYRGSFLYGKMHGKGIYRWPDGGEYIGDYNNNIKEGRGRFRWPNGREFDGPFVSGNPHGIGILNVNGKTQEVEFIDGRVNKNYKKLKVSSSHHSRRTSGAYNNTTDSHENKNSLKNK
jgi:hypothetical protein